MKAGAEAAFLDTNVLLYLLSADERKAAQAEALVGGGGWVSVQVLNEFASVASRKYRLGWDEIREVLGAVRAHCEVAALTPAVHDRGLALAEAGGLSVYDAMIVAAALDRGCTVLWSEDMQDGRHFDGVLQLRNPFKDIH